VLELITTATIFAKATNARDAATALSHLNTAKTIRIAWRNKAVPLMLMNNEITLKSR
jgi:hypothetical protein